MHSNGSHPANVAIGALVEPSRFDGACGVASTALRDELEQLKP